MDNAEKAIEQVNADTIYTSKQFKRIKDNFYVSSSGLGHILWLTGQQCWQWHFMGEEIAERDWGQTYFLYFLYVDFLARTWFQLWKYCARNYTQKKCIKLIKKKHANLQFSKLFLMLKFFLFLSKDSTFFLSLTTACDRIIQKLWSNLTVTDSSFNTIEQLVFQKQRDNSKKLILHN